jgi:hypothetical protein
MCKATAKSIYNKSTHKCRNITNKDEIYNKKWDAWSKLRGVTKYEATALFVKLFDEYAAENPELQNLEYNILQLPNLVKEGTLFELSDAFEGWRAKTFAMNNDYFMERSEVQELFPRPPVRVQNCAVSCLKPIGTGPNQYFPFVVCNPELNESYSLACKTETERDEWVQAISKLSHGVNSGSKTQTTTTNNTKLNVKNVKHEDNTAQANRIARNDLETYMNKVLLRLCSEVDEVAIMKISTACADMDV